MRSFLLFMIVALVLFGFGSAAADNSHVWVISVGVSKYTRPEFHGLDSASDNARRMAQAFRDAKPDDTTVYELTSDSAERSMLPNLPNTLDAIETIRRRAKPADRIIVYFCGHGIETTDGSDVQQYLLLMDVTNLTSEGMLKSSCLNVRELKKMLEDIPCAERLLLLNACRETSDSILKSGGVNKGQSQTKNFEIAASQWKAPVGNSATMFGCRAGEKSYYGKKGQSFFSEALLDGLTGKAADEKGAVTLTSLAKYVGERVPKDVKDELGASLNQHPALIPDIPGVVLRPAAELIACPIFGGQYGKVFSETVQARLSSSREVNLVERTQLNSVLTELRLQNTGIIDEKTAQSLGKQTGAKYVIVGSSELAPGGRLQVNARLVNVETGQLATGVVSECTVNPDDPDTWKPSIQAMAEDLLKAMRRGGLTITNTAKGSIQLPEVSQKTFPSELKKSQSKGDTSINPKDGAVMVWVPEGEFIMGSDSGRDNEKPQRKVYLDSYWMYKYEVTVAQYRKFCDAAKKAMPSAPRWGWKENNPVVNVSWQDAADYAKWVGGHLPTEAQWEKAARGTDGREYPWGNKWDETKCVNNASSTQLVGSLPAGVSPYGCMDMAGNVWEWCADWYDENYYKSAPSRNPSGPLTEGWRVLRGGWSFDDNYCCRCAYRDSSNPNYDISVIGFRIAR